MHLNVGNSVPNYEPATPAHVAAAAEVLTEACAIVNEASRCRSEQPVYTRFAHYEHGAFLSPILFGFPVLGVGDDIDTRTDIRLPANVLSAIGKEWQAQGKSEAYEDAIAGDGTLLTYPDSSNPEHPFTYAIVANSAAERQIEILLKSLISLILRREVTARLLQTHKLGAIDEETRISDKLAGVMIDDALRTTGWRAAARLVGERSRAAGIQLTAEFRNPLFTPAELRARAKVLRRVYNRLKAPRVAIDKVATLLSRGLTVAGPGDDGQLRRILDQLDTGAIRTYLAHLARDAFVCGNGYLVFGEMPDIEMRLVAPETAELTQDGQLRSADGRAQRVLHTRGAEQVGSDYGVSAIEPFVTIAANFDLMNGLLIQARGIELSQAPTETQEWGMSTKQLATRMLSSYGAKIEEILGHATTGIIEPPDDLYFPGHSLMSPASSLFAVSDRQQGTEG